MDDRSPLEELHERARREPVEAVQFNTRIAAHLKRRFDAVVRGLGVETRAYVEAMLNECLPRSERALGLTPHPDSERGR